LTCNCLACIPFIPFSFEQQQQPPSFQLTISNTHRNLPKPPTKVSPLHSKSPRLFTVHYRELILIPAKLDRPAAASTMATSLLSRKRDLVYFTYFTIAIPVAVAVDLHPLYPHSWVPSWMSAIADFYVNTYHDQFMANPPPFFIAYLWSEALIQVPSMIWGWKAIYNSEIRFFFEIRSNTDPPVPSDNPKLPLVLLPFSCLIFITTATCMVEMWCWQIPLSHRLHLTSLYGPYLALCRFPPTYAVPCIFLIVWQLHSC